MSNRYLTDFFTKLEINKSLEYEYRTSILSKGSYGAFGEKYEGDFLDDQITGKGVLIYKDGSKYEGEFFEVNILNYNKTRKKILNIIIRVNDMVMAHLICLMVKFIQENFRM